MNRLQYLWRKFRMRPVADSIYLFVGIVLVSSLLDPPPPRRPYLPAREGRKASRA